MGAQAAERGVAAVERALARETLDKRIVTEALVEKLRASYSDADILAIGRAMQQGAPLDIRVNTLLAKREEVLEQLHAKKIEAVITPYSPLGIRLKDKIPLNKDALFTEGKVEVLGHDPTDHVARIELAGRDYSVNSFLNNEPAVAMVIAQRPGSNALAAAHEVDSVRAVATVGAPYDESQSPQEQDAALGRAMEQSQEAQQRYNLVADWQGVDRRTHKAVGGTARVLCFGDFAMEIDAKNRSFKLKLASGYTDSEESTTAVPTPDAAGHPN